MSEPARQTETREARIARARALSPCIGVCVVNGRANACEGCGRSLKEIGAWGSFTAEQHRDALGAARDRLEKLGKQVDPETEIGALYERLLPEADRYLEPQD